MLGTPLPVLMLQGKISKVSDSCPLNLVSHDPSRLQKALLALFQDPQSSLRPLLIDDVGLTRPPPMLQGNISKVSSYDPLDLFSQDPTRMQKALLALFQDPQNNLRLFLAGKPVQLEAGTSLEVTAAAVSEAFGPQVACMLPAAAVQVLVSALQDVLNQEGRPLACMLVAICQQDDRHGAMSSCCCLVQSVTLVVMRAMPSVYLKGWLLQT